MALLRNQFTRAQHRSHTRRVCEFQLFLRSVLWGGGRNFERLNVERPIFRKFETSNIKITKVELFGVFICKYIFYFYPCLNYSNTQNIWQFNKLGIFGILIFLQIVKFWRFANFRNWTISEIWLFYEFVNLGIF